MALKAADFGRMGSPGCRQLSQLVAVTLATVSTFQLGAVDSKATKGETDNHQEGSPAVA